MGFAFKASVGALAVAVIASVTSVCFVRSAYQKASLQICDLIDLNYYKSEEAPVRSWLESCRFEAARLPVLLSKSETIQRINDELAALHVSHLTLYSPVENREIWENQGLDTGIRSRIVDAFLIVTGVLPQSPADQAGLQPGDVLASLNGETIPSAYDAQTGSGRFVIERAGEEFAVDLRPEELMEDMSPTLSSYGKDVGVLRISSFLSQYFDDNEWKALASRLGEFRRLVIDVRGNAGGSFPGMLRALSPFRCGQELIGDIHHGKATGLRGETDLRNSLDTGSQLEQLHSAAVVHLRTFEGYGCFKGPVTVLMDSETSSVAEIFAQAFYSRPRSRIWGQPSAGQVVMAQWFTVTAFGGDDYSLSIPIAGYRTSDGAQLENQGIYPQKLLHYDVDLALEGRDSWLDDAASTFPNARIVSE